MPTKPLSDAELELFRLRVRVLVLEDLLYQVFLTTLPERASAKFAKNQDVLANILKEAHLRAEESYVETFPVESSDPALLVDEAREAIDDMRRSLERAYERVIDKK